MKLGHGPATCKNVMGMTLVKTKSWIGGGALAIACLVALNLASAQTNRTWNGSLSSDWFNANNWTPVGVPASNDTINFSAGTINLSLSVTINGQFNWSGGTLGGTLSLGAGFQGGTITNLTLGGSTLNGNYAVSGTFNLIWSHRLQGDGSQGKFLISEIEDLIICM
jgi:hypothetical protein